jgi:amidohydrolase/hippurate hydrolase
MREETMDFPMRIETEARRLQESVRNLRRRIHQNPEPAFEEFETAERVREWLERIDVEVRTGVAKTGVLGTLRGRGPGRTVALRADMDALRKEEAVDAAERPHRSQKPGIMHACGHDGHVAGLLGTAEILAGLREEFDGTVRFIFQPAEEGGGGGEIMAREGALDDPAVDAVFALHGWPNLPCGHIGVKYDTSMASAVRFLIDVEGRSGHAAYPHKCIDPVPAAAQVISSLQTIRSREVNPNTGSVVSVTILETGTRAADEAHPGAKNLLPSQANIIPQTVRLWGTSRALTLDGQELQLRRIREIAEGVCAAHGCRAAFWAEKGYPPTVNDRPMTDLVASVGVDLLGKERIHWLEEPSMGGEDFSYYLLRAPGCIFRLGVARGETAADLEKEPALHSDAFDFNDDALVAGMQLMAGVALRFLGGKIET